MIEVDVFNCIEMVKVVFEWVVCFMLCYNVEWGVFLFSYEKFGIELGVDVIGDVFFMIFIVCSCGYLEILGVG